MTSSELKYKFIEIVGLNKGNNGRTCSSHAYCGSTVRRSTILKLVKTDITIKDIIQIHEDVPENIVVKKKRGRKNKRRLIDKVVETVETTYGCRIFEDGKEKCWVGFVGRPFISIFGDKLEGQFVEVTELLDDSEYACDVQRSEDLGGIAKAIIIS
ncbi:hypothetical protein HDV06_000401 [Boothiomyces sp. JEL0866]|nr:hypothetical protein HDV06_000401 [Boothiomyces sp. JEL0866]